MPPFFPYSLVTSLRFFTHPPSMCGLSLACKLIPPPSRLPSHHIKPQQWTSRVAYGLAQTLRFSFDLLAGFKHRKATEDMFLNRVVFLETVAGT